jgi:hypothetical protein
MRRSYSHSIVPGGLLVTSSTTRFTPGDLIGPRGRRTSRSAFGLLHALNPGLWVAPEDVLVSQTEGLVAISRASPLRGRSSRGARGRFALNRLSRF